MSLAKWSLCGTAVLLFDLNVGFGSAWDSRNTSGIDNANSLNAFGSCTPGTADLNCESLPRLNGFFLGFGGDLMLFKHLGAGFQASLQPSRQDYGPLQYRQAFYDFDGIYAPINVKRVSLRIQGGVGAAHTGFSFTQSGCVGTAVCSTSTQPVGSANHFAVNVGVGVQLYVTDHIFVRPEFDYHYVPNFTNQFGSNSVPEAMLWVGYSFGER
jgi:opacity protein-like surface antigen